MLSKIPVFMIIVLDAMLYETILLETLFLKSQKLFFSLFFPNRIPFLIPLGTDEDDDDEGNFDDGEYTTMIDEPIEIKKTKIELNSNQSVSLAPIFLDMNPKPKTKINAEDEPDFSIDANVELKKINKTESVKANPRKLDSSQNKKQKSVVSKEKANHKIDAGFNRKMKNYKSDLLPDFEVPFSPQENDGQFQQPKPLSPRPTSETEPTQFKPDFEPDFSVPFNPQENNGKFQEPTSKPGTNPSQFKPDLEPDFSLSFGPNDNQLSQLKPETSGPVMPSQVSGNLEPDFSVPFLPNQNRPSQVNSKPNRPVSGNNQIVPELEPDFSVPFVPTENALSQTSPNRPASPITSKPTKPFSGNKQNFVPDLEPDFSVPFGPNENGQFFLPQQQHQQQIPATAQPTITTNPSTPKNQFSQELEPDFSVPFGPKENEQFFQHQKPVAAFPVKATTSKNEFTQELEPDFSVPFGSFENEFPQQKPVTTSRPLTASVFPPFLFGDQQSQEPDFEVPFSPSENLTPTQRPSTAFPSRPGENHFSIIYSNKSITKKIVLK